MIQVSTRSDLDRALAQVGHRAGGQRSHLALVPTMGNIHAGHLQLVKAAKLRADITAVSIYVNPTQFNQSDDFTHYPRTLDADLNKLAGEQVDLVFTPDSEEIYPHGETLHAQVESPLAASGLENSHRPGHFRGVATVVCKLFNLFQPTSALFGKKDYQQLAVINAMVNELFQPVEIIAEETVREPDGLALSSRNSRLTDEQRAVAPLLFSTLKTVANDLTHGADYRELEQNAAATLTTAGFNVDYVAVRDRTLRTPEPGDSNLVVLAAAELGKVRLIDNLETVIAATKAA